MSNSKNQPNNRISEDVNLSGMTKELREDVDRIIRDVNMTAGSRVDEILALFHRYVAEREKQARIEEVSQVLAVGFGYAGKLVKSNYTDREMIEAYRDLCVAYEKHLTKRAADLTGPEMPALKETAKS